jgi:hypothetical protein
MMHIEVVTDASWRGSCCRRREMTMRTDAQGREWHWDSRTRTCGTELVLLIEGVQVARLTKASGFRSWETDGGLPIFDNLRDAKAAVERREGLRS